MPVVRGVITSAGALVTIQIGVDQAQRQQILRSGRVIPQPVKLKALIDIGADCCCVDPAAIASLGLLLRGPQFANVPASGGLALAIEREAALRIVHPSGDPARDFVEPLVPLVELPLGLRGYKALLGRDLLARCRFRYDGPAGTFALAY